jgi:hypothetical protein
MGMGANNRNSPQGDWGIIGPLILIFFAVALVGFWPVMVVHGTTDTGGWRWDIHSTYAELAYVGTVGFVAWMIWLGNRPALRAAPPVKAASPGPLPRPVATRPVCLHLRAVKVDSVTDRSVVYRCWCPDCEAELPANFRRLCCATEPEAAHVYNCPQGFREMTS